MYAKWIVHFFGWLILREFSFQGARIVKSSHFELDYMLGRKITFFCMARGLPRPEITWFKDGIELYAHKFFQVHTVRAVVWGKFCLNFMRIIFNIIQYF